jgi:hypothetical protein
MDLTRIQGGQRVAIVLRRAHCKSIAGISISISTPSIAGHSPISILRKSSKHSEIQKEIRYLNRDLYSREMEQARSATKAAQLESRGVKRKMEEG